MTKLDPKIKRILGYVAVFALGVGVVIYKEKQSHQKEMEHLIIENLMLSQQNFDQDRKVFKDSFKKRQEAFDRRFDEKWGKGK